MVRYMECSARTGDGVEEAVFALTRDGIAPGSCWSTMQQRQREREQQTQQDEEGQAQPSKVVLELATRHRPPPGARMHNLVSK